MDEETADRIMSEMERYEWEYDAATANMLDQARLILSEPHPDLYQIRRAHALSLTVIATLQYKGTLE